MDITESVSPVEERVNGVNAWTFSQCPFKGIPCLWPCPSNCQCSGMCPMDVVDDTFNPDVKMVDVFARPPNDISMEY